MKSSMLKCCVFSRGDAVRTGDADPKIEECKALKPARKAVQSQRLAWDGALSDQGFRRPIACGHLTVNLDRHLREVTR